jgi:hypothetical protein
MNPDVYERLCSAIETKFDTTPQFRRSGEVQGLSAASGVVMIVQSGENYAAAAVPERLKTHTIDRMLAHLEAELVKQNRETV